MKSVSELFSLLDQPKNVVITFHQKPDADAMGSALGLYHFLIQLGHTVTVISPTNWAGFLSWMPGCKKVLDYEIQTAKATAALDKAEWLFCLDFNIMERAKRMANKLLSMSCVKILIDHHQEPQVDIFEYGISDVNKSSTAEMVYDFITESGHSNKIN
jgi:phosphoesterase RecJ-like protein